MSQFNEYAKRLDAAFKEARSEFQEAQAALDNARNAVDAFDKFQPQRYAGENAAKLEALNHEYLEAQRTYRAAKGDIWGRFERERASIKAELEAAIKKDCLATPEQVETGTLALIQSGVLTVDDIENLYSRFSDENNSAMLRIVGKFAEERAAELADPGDYDARQRLTMIARAAAEGKGSIMQRWDALEGVSTRLLGYDSNNGRIDPIFRFAARWEELTGEIIEDF